MISPADTRSYGMHFIAADLAQSDLPGAAGRDALSTGIRERRAVEEGWRRVIDYKLIEWGRHPELLEEDDLTPPTPEALRCAIIIARGFQQHDASPPDWVVPDRDGGLVFERQKGDRTVSIMIDGSGSVEIVHWRGSKIVESEHIC